MYPERWSHRDDSKVLAIIAALRRSMQCRQMAPSTTDSHARERAFDITRRNPPAGAPPKAARAEVQGVLDSIGDICPECPPEP